MFLKLTGHTQVTRRRSLKLLGRLGRSQTHQETRMQLDDLSHPLPMIGLPHRDRLLSHWPYGPPGSESVMNELALPAISAAQIQAWGALDQGGGLCAPK